MMRGHRRLDIVACLISAAMLSACGDGSSSDDVDESNSDSNDRDSSKDDEASKDDTSEDDASEDDAAASEAIAVSDENNYTAQSALSIPSVQTAPEVDLEVCWGDVVDDLLCHELAPSRDLQNVAFLRLLGTPKKEAEAKLATGQLQMSEVDGYLEYQPGEDEECTQLSSLSFFGTPIDVEEEYVESSDHTYLFVFSEGDTPGRGAVTMVFVEPTEDTDNVQVQAPTGCGLLDFSANLKGAEPLRVPADRPWVLDYRELTRDGLDNPFPFGSVDQVLIAFYEGMSVAQLEERVLDLELIATKTYELHLDRRGEVDLGVATERDSGKEFEGIEAEADGTWILALMCGGCQNPAPALLTVLDVEAEEKSQ
jgi:hypothetical protein